MSAATGLMLETLPLAGILLAGEREEWHDLFIVCYVAAIGLLLSLAAVVDDAYDLTSWFGIAADAFQY